MIGFKHTVLVLDDEASVRTALERLLTAHGLCVRLHPDPEHLYQAGLPTVPCCLLLDHHLGSGMTGVQVHAELLQRGWDICTIFLTAHWSVQSVVNAMRAGADDFLTKPYDPDALLQAVVKAITHSAEKQQADARASELHGKAATLTGREREIVRLVVAGNLNKQIADMLDIALVTVKVHRGRAMQKLGAGNAAELARLASLAGISGEP